MFSILAVKHERMVEKMKKLMTIVLGLMCAVGMAGMAIAGNIDSPGPPSGGSGMYTLLNLYDYLTSGTALTVQTSFQEPGAGPGSTMKSTKQIGDDVKALFVQCDAAVADVKSGKKFFSTVAGSWGVKTGTMAPGSLYNTILKTGQTTVYRTGDDGTYSATKGKAFSYSTGGGSTVNDLVTGLQWATGPGSKYWVDAIDWAEGLVKDGKDDWRLPNITELQSLFVRSFAVSGPGDPLINRTFFPDVIAGAYWSSTHGWGGDHNSLAADFYYGTAEWGSPSPRFTMAVRGGE